MSACNGCGNAFSCMYPHCAAGASAGLAYESTPDGRDGLTVFADRFRPGEGPYNIRPITLDRDVAIEHKATPSVGVHGPNARCPNCADWPRFDPARARRPPIAPGLNLDDEGEDADQFMRGLDALVGRALRWGGAIAMVVGAVSIMYAEGQRQPAPGVGFGIALALLMGAALLLGRSDDG